MQRLGLHLTDRCQLDCAHCLRDPGAQAFDLGVDVIDKVLGEAARAYGISHVSLTGGEPTLHPQFAEVLDCIARHGATWDMVTNGVRFGAILEMIGTNPDRLKALKSLAFSVDGATEETHDRVRGRGRFREVIAAVSQAAMARLPFGLQLTVTAWNRHEIDEFGLLAARLGAKHVSFPMLQATGTALDAEMFISAPEWERIRQTITALSGVLAIDVYLPVGYPSEQPLSLCGPMKGETLHVDVHGRLSLCCLHSGLPMSGDDRTTAPIHPTGGLAKSYRSLLPILSDAIEARLKSAEDGQDAWSRFPCNGCLAHFGRPSWTDHGAAGPPALRLRRKKARDARAKS